MPAGEWSDIHVGDRVEIVYEHSEYQWRQGVVRRADDWGARVVIDGEDGDIGFSHRTSLKILSKAPILPKRPISPVFYRLKETT